MKLTLEHAYPRWLGRLLGISGASPVIYSTSSKRNIRQAPEIDLAIREVCADCNNGWLHDLERAFRAVMSGPILGLPLTVPMPVEVQLVVATWAVKTWLLLEQVWGAMRGGTGASPMKMLQYMRENNEPPPGTVVWIGAIEIGSRRLRAAIGSMPVQSPSKPPFGVLGVFTIGSVLFNVYVPAFFGDAPIPKTMYNLGLAANPYLIQIWPHEVEEVGWPPEGILPEADLERIWPPGLLTARDT